MTIRVSYVMILVSDMQRAVAFYREVLELPLRFESPNWTEFDTDGATIALHQAASPGVHANASGESRAGQCRPGFRVRNLDDFHQRIVAQGVPCIQEPKDVFGARVARYTDPDGLAFSVGEESAS
jgi:lactoylglutathione lyase